MAQMDAELKERMERMRDIRKKQEQEGLFPEPLPYEPEVKAPTPQQQSSVKRSGATKAPIVVEPVDETTEAKVIPFPNGNRVPNDCWTMTPDIIRSALFGVVKRGQRDFLENALICAVGDTEIRFTGRRLDQADMDVFMHALSLSREGGLGATVYFSKHSFLKSLNRKKSMQSYQWLEESLNRLSTCSLRIRTKRYKIVGSLIDTFMEDENTGEYYLRFSPEISKALEFQTFIPHQGRLKLGRSELAKWLYSYILSQDTSKKSHTVWSKTLQELTGSNSCIKKFNQNIKKAFQTLEQKIPDFLESWSIVQGKIKFRKKAHKQPIAGSEIAGTNW